MNKQTVFAACAVVGMAVFAAQPPKLKPLIPGDYSDPDVIRVGTNYYMVTSGCEWRISGDRCRSNDGREINMRGAKYRGINWGLYTTGTADFKVCDPDI